MKAFLVVVVALVTGGLPAAPWAQGQTKFERGRYLVEVLGACGNCHSPKAPGGEVAGKHPGRVAGAACSCRPCRGRTTRARSRRPISRRSSRTCARFRP